MQYLIAFWGGILSFFSPCVLPLIPAYLSIISGVSASEIIKGDKNLSKKIFLSSVFFVLGFSLVFSLMGAGASYIGSFLFKYKNIFQKTMGIFLILLGIHTTGLLNIKWLNFEKRIRLKNSQYNYFSAFLIGCAFAIGWSPCIGPVLGGILVMASNAGIMSKGFILLLFYSLGLGIPFLLAAFFAGVFFNFISRYKNIFKYIEIFAGLLIILLGFLLFFNKLNFE